LLYYKCTITSTYIIDILYKILENGKVLGAPGKKPKLAPRTGYGLSKGNHYLIIMTIGEPVRKAGGTNTMKIVKVGEYRKHERKPES